MGITLVAVDDGHRAERKRAMAIAGVMPRMAIGVVTLGMGSVEEITIVFVASDAGRDVALDDARLFASGGLEGARRDSVDVA